MQIEKIFGEIPIFHDIKIDKILFESSYPILFTCIENRNIYEKNPDCRCDRDGKVVSFQPCKLGSSVPRSTGSGT